jgi:hypothetical protein
MSIESIKSFEPSPFPENIVTVSPTIIDNEDDDNGVGCECGIDVSLRCSFSPSSNVQRVHRLMTMPSSVKEVARCGSTFGWCLFGTFCSVKED